MPAAFFLLGVLSLRCPSLLGNGRALAEVAVHRLEHGRTLGFVTMLFFLKIAVTAAAIGSGVDGGTLTPSIAIGSALGTVVGEAWPQTWYIEPPPADAIAIIAAAGFLAAAMRSPVSGLWLMIELSAQGVYREEFMALAKGDPCPLLKSKFAVGMLVPMTIAAAAASMSFKLVMSLHDAWNALRTEVVDKSGEEAQPFLLQHKDRAGSHDLDLGFEDLVRPLIPTADEKLSSINEESHPNSVAA